MPVGLYAGANLSTGNGVTTAFAYNFKILDQTHIEVKVDGALKTLGADYTVTGVGLSNGGNVVFTTAPANGALVQRARKVPYKRDQDYQYNGDLREEVVDPDLDTIEMQVQQIAADIARCFKAPLSVTADQGVTDDNWAAAAGMFLRRKNDGSGMEFVSVAPDLSEFSASGAGAVARSWSSKVGDIVSVKDYGAVGDGVVDDRAAIQAAFDSLLTKGGGQVYFPRGTYLINDTIHIGRFSVAANNDVLGFAFALANLEIDLGGSTVRWNGLDQPGTNKVVKADSVGNYDLITNDKPMFSIVACQDFKIGNGYLRGDSATGNRAFSGLWFQGNHNNHSFDTLVAVGMRIPVRHGCAWDHAGAVQYWGYADSPYYKAHVYNAPAVGGWQGDTQDFHACNFAGTMAHYSTESAQNLSITFNAVILGEGVAGTPYGIVMVGGRIVGKGLGIVLATTYDVYMPTGTNEFTMDQYHSESAAAYKIRTSTNAASPAITLSHCDAPYVDIAGGGAKLAITNSGNVKIKRRDANARLDLSCINCTLDTIDIDATTVKGNIFTSLENCKAVGAGSIFTGAGAGDQFLRIFNTGPAAKLPAPTALQYELVNGEDAFSTVVRWAQEALEGFLHRFWHVKNIPHNAATVFGSIWTSGNNYVGDAEIVVTWSGGASANQAARQDRFRISWTRDSGGVVTLGAVVTDAGSSALDGFAAMTSALTIAYNAGTESIDLSITQTNTPTVAMTGYFQGTASLKAGATFQTAPVWTPG